ncbi:SsrA-binding protein SmpB [Candidatus Uhrbacteria bacterium]|nr:SsrA-binding protein SmpB [Candidatus Uhrbacteria bacterium]
MSDFATNKVARRDYEILETLEAGLMLTGAEVKSARAGQMKLQGAYVAFPRAEAWLVGAHIPLYKPAGSRPDYQPDRSRKLLLHRRELAHLLGKQKEKGLTVVPLRLYTRHGKLKLEIGLGRGRKEFEKREKIKRREAEREIRTVMKRR